VLRIDNNVIWVRAATFRERFVLQWGSASRPRHSTPPSTKEEVERSINDQKTNPVPLVSGGKKTLWAFHGNFYWDDQGLGGDDVKALLLQRERRNQQQLNTARSLMRAEESGRPVRVRIPTEIRRAVFERDGGKCIECGSSFDLQYDHVLPVSQGGATTVQNLQLLCADCNLRKSDSL